MDTAKLCSRLMDEGMTAYRKGDYDKTLRIAKKLDKHSYSGAFELEALALQGKGRRKAAIRILRNGVKVAPRVWLLWNLLGNYLSDSENYSEAFNAFQHAIACPNADESCVRYNWSVALARAGQYEEAMRHIERVTGGKHRFRADEHKVALLEDLGRYEEAIALGLRLLHREDLSAASLSLIHAHVAKCLWLSRQDHAAALAHVNRALETTPGSEFALRVLREIEARRSKKAKYFIGLVEQDFSEFGYHSAVRSFHVVADDQDDILTALKSLEPPKIQETMRLLESKSKRRCPDELKGVYRLSAFFVAETDKIKTRK